MANNDWQDVPLESPGVSQPAPSAPEDWQDQPLVRTDDMMATDVPLTFSGLSPETAMNKSVVTALDRLNMSTGNAQGNVEYLKKKFEDVKPIGDSGDLAVLKEGNWFRVDPVNGEISDPWELTKEYMRDAADVAPMLASIPIGILATPAAAGTAAVVGTAAALGAGIEATRTSLGRIVGTYDATPAEQAWDIGFEGLLNAAGAKIGAGVKPTAKWMSNHIDDLATAFKDTVEPWVPNAAKSAASAVANSPMTMFKKVFANFSVGESNFDTMLENPKQTKALMSQLHSMSGGDVSSYHDEALRQQLGVVQNIAENSRKALTNIYGAMRNGILKNVPESFSVNLEDPVYGAYAKAVQNGLGVLQVGGKELSGKEAAEYIAKNGMKNTGFKMLSQEEMAKSIQMGAELDKGLGYLAQDKEAYTIMKDFYGRLGTFVGGQNRTGSEGAKALLDFKKVATDLSHSMANTEAARSTPQIRFLINEARASMDNSVFQEFKKHGIGDSFTKLNSTYSQLSDKFAPLLQAKAQYDKTGNLKTYEGLLNTFLARPGKNASSRFAVDDAIMAADSYGLKNTAKELMDDKVKIQVAEAAKAFNPIKPGLIKADMLGASGAGMLSYGVMTGNVPLVAAAVGVNALRSPNMSRAAIATVQGLSKGQEMLSKIPKRELNALMSSPQAMNSFLLGVTQAPVIRDQADQQFQQLLQQAQQGGQQ